ncbi:MAG: triose-phosphate isomerase [Candidatus Parcubacteria bacterium]|nr:triose-phosphate isomerase [Candidatus Parcubacteria bacterium]
MSSKKILFLNWKANPSSLKEAETLIETTNRLAVLVRDKLKIIIAPPPVYLLPLTHLLQSGIQLASQTIDIPTSGSHTGGIYPALLKENNIGITLVAHSEERKRKNLTSEQISNLLSACLESGLRAVLCVGENQKGNKALKEITSDLNSILNVLITKYPLSLITNAIDIAYEPLWAIGSNQLLDSEYISNQLLAIKNSLTQKFVNPPHLFYGGSVDKSNLGEILALPEIDGVLIGERSSQKEWLEELFQSVV